jgi:hypothetical protein
MHPAAPSLGHRGRPASCKGPWHYICGVAAFINFRRIRIPRVHGVQRLSLSNARLKHMRDSLAQKESIACGKSSVHGSADWVWSYDPVFEWDNEPFVPAANGVHGFHWFTVCAPTGWDPAREEWEVCPCGWRPELGKHYAKAGHVQWWREQIKERGSLGAVYQREYGNRDVG